MMIIHRVANSITRRFSVSFSFFVLRWFRGGGGDRPLRRAQGRALVNPFDKVNVLNTKHCKMMRSERCKMKNERRRGTNKIELRTRKEPKR